MSSSSISSLCSNSVDSSTGSGQAYSLRVRGPTARLFSSTRFDDDAYEYGPLDLESESEEEEMTEEDVVDVTLVHSDSDYGSSEPEDGDDLVSDSLSSSAGQQRIELQTI